MIDNDEVRIETSYRVLVKMCWEATCLSPITNTQRVAHGETVEDARQKIDMLMLREASDRGLRIERTTPVTMTVGGSDE